MLAEKTDNISWGATMHINPERLKARIDAINAMSKNESTSSYGYKNYGKRI